MAAEIRKELPKLEAAIRSKDAADVTVAFAGMRSDIIDFLEALPEDKYVDWADPNAVDTADTKSSIKILTSLNALEKAAREGDWANAQSKVDYIKKDLLGVGGRRRKTRKGKSKKRMTRRR
jgi:hypothetical protein